MMIMTDRELSSSSILSRGKLNGHSSMQQVKVMIITTMILTFKKLSSHSFKPIPALLIVFPKVSLTKLKTF